MRGGRLACGLGDVPGRPLRCASAAAAPQAADQWLNAEAGASGGVALTLMPHEISVTNVRDALARVLADGELREAAQRVSAEIAAMPSADAVAIELARRFG